MRGEQGQTLLLADERLRNRQRQRKPVKRGGAATDFVHQNQTVRRGVLQNLCGFGRLTIKVERPPAKSSDAPMRVKSDPSGRWSRTVRGRSCRRGEQGDERDLPHERIYRPYSGR